MKKTQIGLLFAIMATFAVLGGCGDEILDEFGIDRSDYNFDTSCKSGNSDIDDCSTCCEGIGGDLSFVDRGTCGCAVNSSNDVICDASTDFDSCGTCCETNGFEPTVSYSCINGDCTCTCFDVTPVAE